MEKAKQSAEQGNNLDRVERARFVREVQRYLIAASTNLHENGIDIGQILYDGKSLFIGMDRNLAPSWGFEVRQDTVKMLLAKKYPHLEIGFHPVDMSETPFELV